MPEDALPAEAVLHQLECGASCNEGAPFVLCAATEGAPLWDPRGGTARSRGPLAARRRTEVTLSLTLTATLTLILTLTLALALTLTLPLTLPLPQARVCRGG